MVQKLVNKLKKSLIHYLIKVKGFKEEIDPILKDGKAFKEELDPIYT